MKQALSLSELEDYARQCINSHEYPNDDHRYTLYTCSSCKKSTFRLCIEHHTGSGDGDFKGIIWGTCASCGYIMRLFTFTGSHRKKLFEDRPACECGSKVFSVALCERYEGEEGIPGFFDEGVIVGKCVACGLNRVFVYTD